MATISDSDVQWYSERDIIAQTDLPGPIVVELLPHLPTPPGTYCATAQVYAADSILRARLVVQMLRVGVRLRFIRLAMGQPMTANQLSVGIAEWTALADSHTVQAAAPTPRHPQRQLLAAALFALCALLLGAATGIALVTR